MKVSGFMVPAETVVCVSPMHNVRKVMDLMLENKIGALVVIDRSQYNNNSNDETTKKLPMPCGIITKSDIMKAYKNLVRLDDPCSKIMTKGDLQTCTPAMSRDRAARILEHTHHHHLIVVDNDKEKTKSEFLGLLSSWDITSECAKDDRAWPFLRSEDGKFHGASPQLEKLTAARHQHPQQRRATSPDQAEDHPTIAHHEHDEFTTYMDDLDLLGIQ